ncbi:MAG: hypothetical protein ACYSUC_04340 [Planctomycetota bacterium]|jgi:hypothetical protein
MSDFDEFIEKIEEGLKQLSQATLKDFKDGFASDAKDFLEDSKEDLQTWTKQLADGKLSKKDFEDLVLGRKDVAEMHALKVAEITKAKLELFKLQVIDLVVDTAFTVFL